MGVAVLDERFSVNGSPLYALGGTFVGTGNVLIRKLLI
jgi:hypothetical protein